jgi:hypothetical protein
MKKDELLDSIVEFINFEKDALMDHVCDDLGIKVDHECSNLYDMVDDRFTDKSFKEIIDAVITRISTAIESYKSGES